MSTHDSIRATPPEPDHQGACEDDRDMGPAALSPRSQRPNSPLPLADTDDVSPGDINAGDAARGRDCKEKDEQASVRPDAEACSPRNTLHTAASAREELLVA